MSLIALSRGIRLAAATLGLLGLACTSPLQPRGGSPRDAGDGARDAGTDAASPRDAGGVRFTDAGGTDAGACASGACGGRCGPCPPVDDGCVELTAEEYENNEGNDAEFTAKFFPTDNRNGEYIDMFFRSDAPGLHRYGEGDNADLYTCEQCMLIWRNGAFYYPVSGTLEIASDSAPLGRRLQANLSELRLIEIEISDSYHSIPVAGGECLRLAPAVIDVR